MSVESYRWIGPACARSSDLPCGTPSITSTRTTSPSSFSTTYWATEAPTLPAPTTVIFGLPEATRASPCSGSSPCRPSVCVSYRAAVATEQALTAEPPDVLDHDATSEQFAADLVDFNDASL